MPRYSDSGTSASEVGADVADLTTFITQLTSDGSFEFWDSTGTRRTGSGDADITAAKVKNAVAFENVNVTGTYTPGVWNVRAGVDLGGGTLGKLKVNCRNRINSTTYNSDGLPPGTATVTSGTSLDVWDTVDDVTSPLQFPTTWSLENNYCGGFETVADDSNVWKDVTTTPTVGCNATNCRLKDKISGLEWSKTIQTSRDWSQAINDCAGLTHDGVSGWRLPTQKEMEGAYTHSMMSAQRTNWITAAQMQAGDYFWSSTSASQSLAPTYAWAMSFSHGAVASYLKTAFKQVACVR